MKASPFEYVRVSSVDEAVAQLAELGDEAKVLAGGQSLVPLLNLRLANPAYLVDINPIGELNFITTVRASGWAPWPATEMWNVPRWSLGQSAPGSCPHAGRPRRHPQPGDHRRQRGPRRSGGGASDHFGGTRRGDRGPQLQRDPHYCGSGFLRELLDHGSSTRRAADRGEVSQPAGRVRVVDPGVQPPQRRLRRGHRCGHSGRGTNGNIGEARVAFGGMAGTAVRALSAEAALAGQTPSAELWKAAGQEAAAGLDPPGDLHSTPEHRRHLAAVLTERALVEAYGRMGQKG